MPKFARLDSLGRVIEEVDRPSPLEPGTIRRYLDTGVPFLAEIVGGQKPSIDPSLQRLEGPFYALSGDVVAKEWRVVDLSPEERFEAMRSEYRLRRGEYLVLFSLNNRIRALEGKPPLTTEQFDAMVLDLCLKDPRK